MATVSRIEVDFAASDDALALARAGDVAARWGVLEACRQYLRLVVGRNRWAKGALEPATSDLVQETILDGWRGFARFEGRTQGQLRAWLRVTLVHTLIKARRRPVPARLESRSGGEAISGCVTPPFIAVQRADSNEAIDAALAALPEHYRAVIRWRLWDNLPYTQIGSRLEISDDSAQKLFGRAIASLRKLLGPGHDPG
jgi:RNA polymerase sigma-70 factor (ECF subfamily)